MDPRLKPTSTGIGHAYLPAVKFNFMGREDTTLPPKLRTGELVSPATHYATTTHSVHDRKFLTRPLSYPRHPMAAPHCSTNYTFQLVEKLNNSEPFRPSCLPMSEMQDNYKALRDPCEPRREHYEPAVAYYKNQEKDFVSGLKVPYLSTTQANHRPFDRQELDLLSAVDAAAIPDKEKYRMSKTLPKIRESPPQSLEAHQTIFPCPSKPVPHKGKNSLYADSYTPPVNPVFSPDLPDWSLVQQNGSDGKFLWDIFEVPKMYSTENSTYGSNKAVVV